MAGLNNVGLSVFAGEPAIPEAGTGRVFWVGATATVPGGVAGSDNAGAFGSTPQKPFATLDYAMGFTTANQGDVIYLLPQHQENLTTATAFQMDVAGVSVIGLGRGTDRPTFNFTGTAGSVEMDAANCRISNVVLTSDITAVVVGVNIDADYCEFDHNEMNVNQGTVDDFIIYIDVDTVSDAYIHDNVFYAETATAGSNTAIRLDTADLVRIEDNIIMGDFAVAAINGVGAANTTDGGCMILNNYIHNSDTAAAVNLIDIDVAVTGLIAQNIMGTNHAAAVTDIGVDTGSCLNAENYAANLTNETGQVTPSVASS